jgi:hypothetical protein
VPDRGLLERDRLHVPAALHLLLATWLFDDVAAALREHGLATLDAHSVTFTALTESWSAVTATCAIVHHGLPGDDYHGYAS